MVGVYGDDTVTAVRGSPVFPIMNLHERVLSILACRYVDDVVIEAPLEISDSFLDYGKYNFSAVITTETEATIGNDRFRAARARNLLKTVSFPGSDDLSARPVMDRVAANRASFEERNLKKESKERDLLKSLSE